MFCVSSLFSFRRIPAKAFSCPHSKPHLFSFRLWGFLPLQIRFRLWEMLPDPLLPFRLRKMRGQLLVRVFLREVLFRSFSLSSLLFAGFFSGRAFSEMRAFAQINKIAALSSAIRISMFYCLCFFCFVCQDASTSETAGSLSVHFRGFSFPGAGGSCAVSFVRLLTRTLHRR